MPRYEDRDRGERRYDKGEGYAPLSSNQYNRGGRADIGGLDAGGTRLYIGRLSSRTRSNDLEDLFSKYGRVRDVDMKHNFAFVEFLDARDADDARHYTNGKDLDGSRLIVEFARRRVMDMGPRGLGGVRDHLGRGLAPGTGRCYNCGDEGHWARDCKAGDWRDKCYRCGQRGHVERNCRNSPAPNSSLSRSRSRSPRKPQKGLSQSRSRSYSLSPLRKADRISPVKDSQKGSKSRSLTPAPKIRSVTTSPARNNVSASPSPAHHSHSPEPPQVEVDNLLVQESRQESSRSLSLSPVIIDMEKLTPAKVVSDKSPVTPISEE